MKKRYFAAIVAVTLLITLVLVSIKPDEVTETVTSDLKTNINSYLTAPEVKTLVKDETESAVASLSESVSKYVTSEVKNNTIDVDTLSKNIADKVNTSLTTTPEVNLDEISEGIVSMVLYTLNEHDSKWNQIIDDRFSEYETKIQQLTESLSTVNNNYAKLAQFLTVNTVNTTELAVVTFELEYLRSISLILRSDIDGIVSNYTILAKLCDDRYNEYLTKVTDLQNQINTLNEQMTVMFNKCQQDIALLEQTFDIKLTELSASIYEALSTLDVDYNLDVEILDQRLTQNIVTGDNNLSQVIDNTRTEINNTIDNLDSTIAENLQKLENKVDTSDAALDSKLDETNKETNDKIDQNVSDLTDKIDLAELNLNNKIDLTTTDLTDRILVLNNYMTQEDNKILQTILTLQNTVRLEDTKLNTTITNLSNTTSVNFTNVNKTITDLSNKTKTDITALQNKINIDLKNTVDGINTDLDELRAKDAELSTRVDECFQSVSDGKRKIASAITGKGINTTADATFDTMAKNINGLVTMSSNPSVLFGNTSWTAPYDCIAVVSFAYTMECNNNYDQIARIYLKNSDKYWDFGWGGNSSSDAGWHTRGTQGNATWEAKAGVTYYFDIDYEYWSEGGHSEGGVLGGNGHYTSTTWIVPSGRSRAANTVTKETYYEAILRWEEEGAFDQPSKEILMEE